MSGTNLNSKYERDLQADNGLSRGARACAALVARVQAGNLFRAVQISQAFLAKALGVCDRTVRRYLRELEESGWLASRVQRMKVAGVWVHLPNRYVFLPRQSVALALPGRNVMRVAEQVRKAVAARLARRPSALSDICVRREASRVLKGEPNGSLSLFERQMIAAKYGGEAWDAMLALPDRG